MIDASPVAAPDTREVPDLSSVFAGMDIWCLSGVAKALSGAACIKSQRPVCSCSRCALGAGGGIGCALSRKKWEQHPLKRKQRLSFNKVSFQFFLLFTSICSSRICSKLIYFSDPTFKKDDLSSWSPSREKLRRINRIRTLVRPLLRQDYFWHKTCRHLLDNLSLCICSKSSTFFSLVPIRTAKTR